MADEGSTGRARLRRVGAETLLSAGLFVTLHFALWGMFSGGGEAAGFNPLTLLLRVLAYLLPWFVMLIAISGRTGFVIGPPLTVVFLFLFSVVHRHFDEAAVSRYATSSVTEATLPVDTLAYDDVSPDCGPRCDAPALMNSSYSIARSSPWKRDRNQGWDVFRRASGETCTASDNVRSTLAFLSAGYLDSCETKTTEQDVSHALIFRERRIQGWSPPPADVPRLYFGEINEIVERQNGQELTLARQLTGAIMSPLPEALEFYGVRRSSVHLGPELNLARFQSWALHVTPEEFERLPANADLAELLDSAESYFNQPAVGKYAGATWTAIARERGRDNPDLILSRIEGFLSTDDPVRVDTAINALWDVHRPLPDDHKARLKVLLYKRIDTVPYYLRDPNDMLIRLSRVLSLAD